MEIRFQSADYDRLEVDPYFMGGWPAAVVKEYRFCLHYLRQAMDERDLEALKCLELQRLDGHRKHQHSLDLNDEWRLVIEIDSSGSNKTVVIVNIEESN